MRQSSLLTSYPVTLYWEEEEEKDLSAGLKLFGTGRKGSYGNKEMIWNVKEIAR